MLLLSCCSNAIDIDGRNFPICSRPRLRALSIFSKRCCMFDKCDSKLDPSGIPSLLLSMFFSGTLFCMMCLRSIIARGLSSCINISRVPTESLSPLSLLADAISINDVDFMNFLSSSLLSTNRTTVRRGDNGFGDLTRMDDLWCVVGPLLPVVLPQLPPPNALEKTLFIKSIIVAVHRFFCRCYWHACYLLNTILLAAYQAR